MKKKCRNFLLDTIEFDVYVRQLHTHEDPASNERNDDAYKADTNEKDPVELGS